MKPGTGLWAALLIPLACNGCAEWSASASALTAAASGQASAVQVNVQAVHDLNAKAWTELACATSIGELARNGSGNPNFPAAVMMLCWPQVSVSMKPLIGAH